MTSSANLELKLSYAFDLYDTDGSGYLNKQEIQVGLVAMLDLLNVNKSRQNDLKLANEFLTLLDANNDGIVSKSKILICLEYQLFNRLVLEFSYNFR